MNTQLAGSRIEVCGGIASGKTTLATILVKEPNAVGLFENFQANPFLKAFYADPVAHAFETEVTFLLQHFHQIKTQTTPNKMVVCDFSMILDRAYVDVTLSGSSRDAFLAVFNEIMRRLPQPSLIIHLQCTAEEELSRIRRRARPVENSIEIEYLKQINKAVNLHAMRVWGDVEVLTVDSVRHNFADDSAVQRDIVNLVHAKLEKCRLKEIRM
jgi:deoxyguanosine kinase